MRQVEYVGVAAGKGFARSMNGCGMVSGNYLVVEILLAKLMESSYLVPTCAWLAVWE